MTVESASSLGKFGPKLGSVLACLHRLSVEDLQVLDSANLLSYHKRAAHRVEKFHTRMYLRTPKKADQW
jgi:hypothetical protein